MLAVQQKMLSRKHATVTREDEEWIIRDAGSINGVLVDGKRVKQAVLDDGCIVALGGTSLQCSPLHL